MDLLENVVQPYAWGSFAAIAELRGLPTPSETPEAELWLGAHPAAPSISERGDRRPLGQRIAAAPEAELGARVSRAFGELPFLLKILAARTPLSLQAHPTLEQARAGFDAEEAAGVPRGAAHRNYKDRNHKPELICALGPFDALCGFRAVDETRALFTELGTLAELSARLDALPSAFGWLMRLPKAEQTALVDATLAACRRVESPRFARERAWALRLGETYPGDVGVIGALLLNLVRLEAGEAIYLPAGNLHAYLEGVGVEIMASSDNVLRGGLTPKHVDVAELLRVLDFHAGPVSKVLPVREGDLERWPTPAREFALARVVLESGRWSAPLDGPVIAICTEGVLRARDAHGERTLSRGVSVFVPADARQLALEGTGTLFLAGVP